MSINTLLERFESNGKYLNEVLDYDLKDNEKIRSIAEAEKDKIRSIAEAEHEKSDNITVFFMTFVGALLLCGFIYFLYLIYLDPY